MVDQKKEREIKSAFNILLFSLAALNLKALFTVSTPLIGYYCLVPQIAMFFSDLALSV